MILKRIKEKPFSKHIADAKTAQRQMGSRLALLDFHDSIEQGTDNGENVIKHMYIPRVLLWDVN